MSLIRSNVAFNYLDQYLTAKQTIFSMNNISWLKLNFLAIKRNLVIQRAFLILLLIVLFILRQKLLFFPLLG